MRRRVGALTVALALTGLGLAAAAGAVSVQQGTLRISVFAQLKPPKLPRHTPAPIAVSVAGHLESITGGVPPQLQSMRIKVNKHGLLQSKGLPVCPLGRLAAASSGKALELCRGALVGSGQFWAHIVLPDQGAYPTRGEILIFNSMRQGKPVLLAHIFTSNPFDSAFTIAFSIKHVAQGRYGTELYASLPEALGEWGFVDRIKLNLKREYTYRGRRLSYFNAACPAPQGTDSASFKLAEATLSFSTTSLTATVVKACRVKE